MCDDVSFFCCSFLCTTYHGYPLPIFTYFRASFVRLEQPPYIQSPLDFLVTMKTTAFGLAAAGVVMTTPISNFDIANGAITQDPIPFSTETIRIIKSDGTVTAPASTTMGVPTFLFGVAKDSVFATSPTTLYLSQITPRKVIVDARATIQQNWITYIDNNNWTTLINSYNTLNPQIRNSANTIVNNNPQIPALATRRTAMFSQLDSAKVAFNAQDNLLSIARTFNLITRISDFLVLAPLP
jgi:hypothetical protein